MSALQLMQSMQQPHADPMQMPAHILAREYVERLARGSEGHPLGRERRRDPGAARAPPPLRSPPPARDGGGPGGALPLHPKPRGGPAASQADPAPVFRDRTRSSHGMRAGSAAASACSETGGSGPTTPASIAALAARFTAGCPYPNATAPSAMM